MNKIQLLLLVLGFPLLVSAQKYTVIKGNVKTGGTEVTLYKVTDGAINACAKTEVSPNGSFGFVVAPENPAFYALGTERMNHIIYVKGGEEINIDIEESKAKLNGRNSKENRALYQWEDFLFPIRFKADIVLSPQGTYQDFFPEYTRFLAAVPAVRSKLKSGNPGFDALLQKKIDYDLDYYPVLFLQGPRRIRPQASDLPEFYKSIVSEEKFTTDEILQLPDGVKMMWHYLSFAFRESGDKESSIDKYLAFLKNDRLKGEYLLMHSKGMVSYRRYMEMVDKYENYFVTPSQKARAEALGAGLYDTIPGTMAADFTYPDVNGNQVSLSDFKGKVVLVDVWATWCGPCRQQIPYLKRLEEEMHGKGIVFMSVSVDESENHGKWKQMVEKEGLTGVQLFAGGWGSSITKAYKIKGIPRFMMFDKNGKLISANTPRPSQPELKQMLEDALMVE